MNNAQAQQFVALQKATAAYNNETKTADHMRRREVDLMNREQERLRLLEEELRAAHGAFGEETRIQKNLEVERTRYRQATEVDRQAIVKITSEMQGTEVSGWHPFSRWVLRPAVANIERHCLSLRHLRRRRRNRKSNLSKRWKP